MTSHEIGSSGSSGVGNTYNPAYPVMPADNTRDDRKETRGAPALHWCFTWNNYDEKSWFQWFQETKLWDDVETYMMGEEVGEEKNTPHLQCYVKFKKKKRFEAILREWPEVQMLRTARNIKASIAYCAKDGKYKTNIKMPRAVTFHETFDLPWEVEILDIICQVPDLRTIHWFWEPVGNVGKSRFTKYLVVKYGAVMIPSKQTDAFHAIAKLFEAGTAIDIVVIDIPRVAAQYVSYGAIEAIKNGLICSGKYEGATCAFAEPHVIIFANFEPNYEVLSVDRWSVKRI